jgi:hypothetical protein
MTTHVRSKRLGKSSLRKEFLFGIFVSLPPTAASRTPPHTLRNSSRLGLFRSNLEEISLVYGYLVTKLLRKRSRWRKNSVLSPSRARKLARSRLPQPCLPNPPRNPCFFRPTRPGLRAEQSSPTATAASERPRAAIEAIKGPRRACRAPSRFRFRSQVRPST